MSGITWEGVTPMQVRARVLTVWAVSTLGALLLLSAPASAVVTIDWVADR